MVKGEKEGGLIGIGEVRELDMSQVGVWDAALWLLWCQSWFQGVLVHCVILIKVFLCPEKNHMRIRNQFICLCICVKKYTVSVGLQGGFVACLVCGVQQPCFQLGSTAAMDSNADPQ